MRIPSAIKIPQGNKETFKMSEEKVRKTRASGLPRIKMPAQDPVRRATNFEEVPYGISLEMAMDEASRCLHCPKPRCMAACPVNINIPSFIEEIAKGDPKAAADKLKKQTALPAVCGRVCPQEIQCEGSCILGIKKEPVAIGMLERFAADYVRLNNLEDAPECAPKNGKKVAIIGCGPAGITAASDLALAGCDVEIFEALHLAGGVLMYGIPQFRLPKEIVSHEIEGLKKLGVKIHLNYTVGKLAGIQEFINDGFDAIFIGTGAGLPMFQGIPGENSVGVFSANEFLTRFNLMKAYRFPEFGTTPVKAKHIVTIGGGNVAMDSSRTALRIGAKSTLVYRRAIEQMPARKEEIHHAQEEGVVFQVLSGAKRILADEKGRVRGLECVKMELGEPDSSGRKSVKELPGTEFVIECDAIVEAIGNRPNPLIPLTTPTLKLTEKGTIACDPDTLQTSIPQVFAGGDAVSGAATVISAMGQGKKAAASILKFVNGQL